MNQFFIWAHSKFSEIIGGNNDVDANTLFQMMLDLTDENISQKQFCDVYKGGGSIYNEYHEGLKNGTLPFNQNDVENQLDLIENYFTQQKQNQSDSYNSSEISYASDPYLDNEGYAEEDEEDYYDEDSFLNTVVNFGADNHTNDENCFNKGVFLKEGKLFDQYEYYGEEEEEEEGNSEIRIPTDEQMIEEKELNEKFRDEFRKQFKNEFIKQFKAELNPNNKEKVKEKSVKREQKDKIIINNDRRQHFKDSFNNQFREELSLDKEIIENDVKQQFLDDFQIEFTDNLPNELNEKLNFNKITGKSMESKFMVQIENELVDSLQKELIEELNHEEEEEEEEDEEEEADDIVEIEFQENDSNEKNDVSIIVPPYIQKMCQKYIPPQKTVDIKTKINEVEIQYYEEDNNEHDIKIMVPQHIQEICTKPLSLQKANLITTANNSIDINYYKSSNNTDCNIKIIVPPYVQDKCKKSLSSGDLKVNSTVDIQYYVINDHGTQNLKVIVPPRVDELCKRSLSSQEVESKIEDDGTVKIKYHKRNGHDNTKVIVPPRIQTMLQNNIKSLPDNDTVDIQFIDTNDTKKRTKVIVPPEINEMSQKSTLQQDSDLKFAFNTKTHKIYPIDPSEHEMDGKLHLYALNVGYGNLIILSIGSKAIIFDCGSAELTEEMEKNNHIPGPFLFPASTILKTKQIEFVVITHPRKDHFNMIKAVLDKSGHDINDIQFICGGYEEQYKDFTFNNRQFTLDLDELDNETILCKKQEFETMLNNFLRKERVYFNFLIPLNFKEDPKKCKNNDYSNIILTVDYNGKRLLIPGNSTQKTIDSLNYYDSQFLQNIDVFIVPNHGTCTKDKDIPLNIKSKLALISSDPRFTKCSSLGCPNSKYISKLVNNFDSEAPSHKLLVWESNEKSYELDISVPLFSVSNNYFKYNNFCFNGIHLSTSEDDEIEFEYRDPKFMKGTK